MTGFRNLGLLILTAVVPTACKTTVVMPNAAASVAAQLSVERFLQAANERDVLAMGNLFGTEDGPAMDTGGSFGCAFKRIGSWFGGTRCATKQEVEIRMDAIALVLAHQDYRIVREERVVGRTAPTTRVLVDMTVPVLDRYGERAWEAVSAVPFVVVRTSEGRWLVQEVDLERMMSRGRCRNPRGLGSRGGGLLVRALHELGEDSARAGWMKKGHHVAVGARPRCAVDELHAAGLESREFALEIVGAVRDVVEGLATPREKSAHGGFGTERLEEFDRADEGHPNALGLEGFGCGTALARQEFEETGTLFYRVNGDRHVIDRATHRRRMRHRSGSPWFRDGVNDRTIGPDTLQGEPRWKRVT